ncbi:MAG: hypothetical protein JWR38_1961 [Mucilaginibacter sp.]|nr:hypothetical protein [Mucilaginibacter sp.]
MKANNNQQTAEAALAVKNEAVTKAYKAIITEVKQLITLFSTDYLRTFIEVDYSSIGFTSIYGFYSPLLHLRLEQTDGVNTIYFARNYSFKAQIGYHLDAVLSRCVYKHTSKTNTGVDIEDSLDISIYNLEDYKQTKGLMDRGFKGAVKTTVEVSKLQA